MKERTYLEEAEYRLANSLAWLESSFVNLYGLLNLSIPEIYTHIIFVKDELRNRLLYYIDRAPLKTHFVEAGLELIHNHLYDNYLIVFESDFPNSRLWKHFDNFLCALLFGDSDMITAMPYLSMYASRGHDLISLTIGSTWTTLRELVQGYRHDCSQDAVFEKLVLPEQISWSLFDSMIDQTIYKPITPTGSYRCPTCGAESIISVLNMRKLKRMYERYAEQIETDL
jgi:hypothetical protein